MNVVDLLTRISFLVFFLKNNCLNTLLETIKGIVDVFVRMIRCRIRFPPDKSVKCSCDVSKGELEWYFFNITFLL